MVSPQKLIILLGLLIMTVSCEKEVEFAFEIDHLTDTRWGIPQINMHDPALYEFDLSYPTIFNADGTMSVGGRTFNDWSIHSSRSLHLLQSRELWHIIALNPERLRVVKSRFPTGEFLAECVYHPMD